MYTGLSVQRDFSINQYMTPYFIWVSVLNIRSRGNYFTLHGLPWYLQNKCSTMIFLTLWNQAISNVPKFYNCWDDGDDEFSFLCYNTPASLWLISHETLCHCRELSKEKIPCICKRLGIFWIKVAHSYSKITHRGLPTYTCDMELGHP